MFEDSQIEARTLRDWRGDWQSVYPYLVDGTLDPVMADKAAHGDKTESNYRAYYTIRISDPGRRFSGHHHHRRHCHPSTRTASRMHGT